MKKVYRIGVTKLILFVNDQKSNILFFWITFSISFPTPNVLKIFFAKYMRWWSNVRAVLFTILQLRSGTLPWQKQRPVSHIRDGMYSLQTYRWGMPRLANIHADNFIQIWNMSSPMPALSTYIQSINCKFLCEVLFIHSKLLEENKQLIDLLIKN